MATNVRKIDNLDVPFKEFMPGQIIQSGQFNDDMKDIEDKVNEIIGEQNTLVDEVNAHIDNFENPHQVTAHQTGTYTSQEIDEFVEDIKSGNLHDNAIGNRVLDDDCVSTRNILDGSITSSKLDGSVGSQIDISTNVSIKDRYTKEETDAIIQEKVGSGTYDKATIDEKLEQIQAGQILDKSISIHQLKDDVGRRLDISNNPDIINKYTREEVDLLIRNNALPRDWGSILEGDDDTPVEIPTKEITLPVANHMKANTFTVSESSILDVDIQENVDARGEFNTVGERLDSVDSQIKEVEDIKNYLVDIEINVKKFGAIGDGITDDTVCIQNCLQSGYKKVYIPAGRYKITKQLKVFSNTYLEMDKDAILLNYIHRSDNAGSGIAVISNFIVGENVPNYTGESNIVIRGGKIICIPNYDEFEYLKSLGDVGNEGISIAHAKNIVIDNVYIQDVYRGHGIEITGCDGIEIKNCIFDGWKSDERYDLVKVKEAIQIEHCAEGVSLAYQDNTLSKNINIHHNIVEKISSIYENYPSGIGSHNNSNDKTFDNIHIYNNIIKNCTFGGILYSNYKYSTLNNNNIIDCERGIGYYQARPLANIDIKGNVFQNINKTGISIIDSSHNISIVNNDFKNIQESAISVMNSNATKIYDNKLLNCCLDSTTNAYIQLYGITSSWVFNNWLDKDESSPIPKYGIIFGDTERYRIYNTVQKDNIMLFYPSVQDIIVTQSMIDNVNVIYGEDIPIVDGAKVKTKLNPLKFKSLILDLDVGALYRIEVPVKIGDITIIINNVGDNISSNNLSMIEFYINIDEYGNISIKLPRMATIANGNQSTINITTGYKMFVKQIKGTY